MDTAQILADLRTQRDRINNAIAALEALNGTAVSRPAITVVAEAPIPVPQPTTKKRGISPEGLKRIAEAAKKRWAAKKVTPVAAAKQAAPKGATAKTSKRVISSESGKKMAEAQQKRWAKKKRAAKAAAKKATTPVVTAAAKEAPKALSR
jgi:hypothetical protein